MPFIIYFAVAIVFGLAGATLLGFEMPGGIVGAMVAGLLGAWIGDIVIGAAGVAPQVYNVNLIPAAFGARAVVLIIGWLGKRAESCRSHELCRNMDCVLRTALCL